MRLLEEMVRQRSAGGQGFENKIAPLLVISTLLSRHGRGLGGIEVIAPFLAQLRQPLHFGLKIVEGFGVRFIGWITLVSLGGSAASF